MAELAIQSCCELLTAEGLTIAFAESATAGWLCSEFALVKESGKVLKGGIVCYDAGLKVDLLGISETLIQKYTPESMEVTQAMAESISKKISSDIQVAITGLTCPGGSETPEKPVGTVFIAVMAVGKLYTMRQVFQGSKEEIIHQAVVAAATLISGGVLEMRQQRDPEDKQEL